MTLPLVWGETCTCFNRAARFARLVAREDDKEDDNETDGFNRAARFARLVALSKCRQLPRLTMGGFNRAARFARLVARIAHTLLPILRTSFNRAARFARLVAGQLARFLPSWMRSFNRAARFARLVAFGAVSQVLETTLCVSIGPRVSRGWWRHL